jgi:FlaA1/EpsC-like NDP-sugar epimerase
MQAAVLGQGGEIFVLDKGQLVKIADLAKQMIELSGFTVGELSLAIVKWRRVAADQNRS